MKEKFEQYWKIRGTILEKLGVSKDIAKMIWDDCTNVAHDIITDELIKLSSKRK